MEAILDGATAAQRAAIEHLAGPLLVLAGPGSGKTRVVTHRIAWLLEQGVPPASLIAITFTNKAAQEMRERVDRLVGTSGLWISTFHAMGARMLRRFAAYAGLEPNFTIFDDQDQRRLMRDILRGMDVDTTRFRPQAVAAVISRFKTELVSASQAAANASHFLEEIAARVYPVYERRLAESNGVDFDDLLAKNLKLLNGCEPAREHYQRRFEFVLVDEYQDTNRVQFNLLRTLAAPQNNLHVTGDPDQSIYRFRGADIRNILDFEKQYPKAKVVRLEENFRSTKHILKAADSLIRHNRDRKHKELIPTRDGGQQVRLLAAMDEEEEGREVASRVGRAADRGVSLSDIAVFYRVHALSRSLERAFFDQGIPYTIVRGTEFFRRAEVMDLLAYLKVVANPRDAESLLRILNVPARGIGQVSRDRLVALAEGWRLPLLDTIHRAAKGGEIRGRARTGVGEVSRLFDSLTKEAMDSVADILEALVKRIDYGGHLKSKYPEDHEDRWENISQLVASAAEHQEKYPAEGLPHYLQEIALLSDADDGEFGTERVPFMTLHTAKGLEFKNVFIVGLEDGLLPHSRSFDSPAEMEEERRLLFVGITRAEEELYLSYARRRFRWGQQGTGRASSFLSEIDQGAIESPAEEADPELHYEVDEWVEQDASVSLKPGTLVRHSRFGVGRVASMSGSGVSTRVTVDFSTAGKKRLLLHYAKLTIAEGEAW